MSHPLLRRLLWRLLVFAIGFNVGANLHRRYMPPDDQFQELQDLRHQHHDDGWPKGTNPDRDYRFNTWAI